MSQSQQTKVNGGGEDYKKVINAVRDFIFERHKFPQVNDIVESTGIQKTRCNEVIDQLVKQKQLYVVFGGEGLPKIILLYDMMQGVLMTQKKPDWLENDGFSEKKQISQKIETLQKEAIRYEQFERLLYSTDIPLEESIAYTLDWLGFKSVHHHKDDKDNPDVTFEYQGVKAILEAEGTTKAGPKDKILQLNGWIQREIAGGAEVSNLRGFFAVNHFRDIEPSKRGEPLTQHAKEFLKLYDKFVYFTTTFLFNIIKDVINGKLTKEEAQNRIWQGEKLS